MVYFNSPWRPPSHIQPTKSNVATPTSSTNSDAVRAVANLSTMRAVPLWNKLPAEVVNALNGEIFQDTPGCPLAVPVPRGTHLTHLLSQPIPLAHIDNVKKSHPNDPSHIPQHPTRPLIVVLVCSLDMKETIKRICKCIFVQAIPLFAAFLNVPK